MTWSEVQKIEAPTRCCWSYELWPTREESSSPGFYSPLRSCQTRDLMIFPRSSSAMKTRELSKTNVCQRLMLCQVLVFKSLAMMMLIVEWSRYAWRRWRGGCLVAVQYPWLVILYFSVRLSSQSHGSLHLHLLNSFEGLNNAIHAMPWVATSAKSRDSHAQERWAAVDKTNVPLEDLCKSVRFSIALSLNWYLKLVAENCYSWVADGVSQNINGARYSKMLQIGSRECGRFASVAEAYAPNGKHFHVWSRGCRGEFGGSCELKFLRDGGDSPLNFLHDWLSICIRIKSNLRWAQGMIKHWAVDKWSISLPAWGLWSLENDLELEVLNCSRSRFGFNQSTTKELSSLGRCWGMDWLMMNIRLQSLVVPAAGLIKPISDDEQPLKQTFLVYFCRGILTASMDCWVSTSKSEQRICCFWNFPPSLRMYSKQIMDITTINCLANNLCTVAK